MLVNPRRPVQPKSVRGIDQFVIYDYLCLGREIDATFYLSLSNIFIFTKYFLVMVLPLPVCEYPLYAR